MDITATERNAQLAILGGGPAGLATGYYARKKGLPITLFEAAPVVGGNCITLSQGDFRFDSGAHRLHDKDPEVTSEMQQLLGERLHRVDIPSQIYHEGSFVDFPLSPFNLLKVLGPASATVAVFDMLRQRLSGPGNIDSFEDYAIGKYGRTLAEMFLLNYSEKLWGRPTSELSPKIAGKRLQGLDVRTLISEALRGRKGGAAHMEGAFYYPLQGIGEITDALADVCGRENVRTDSRITRVLHDGSRITSVEVNGSETFDVGSVACTLPLSVTAEILEPSAPEEILHAARSLRYRNVILTAFFIDRPSITKAATVYFPSKVFPFNRIYEPRNRSKAMSPEGKTSLVAEVPCQPEDPAWEFPDEHWIERVQGELERLGWIKEGELLGTAAYRIINAYPVLELGFEERAGRILDYLGGFGNLHMAGRSGLFRYAWMHDMIRAGKDIVEKLTR